MIRAAVIGAGGRMGCALVRAALELPEIRIAGAVASQDSSALGRDAGELAGAGRIGVAVSADLTAVLAGADVAIDFSSARATAANLAACRSMGKALLIGTTGYAPELAPQLQAAGSDIPLLVAPNTSIAITLLIELVRQAAAALPDSFDVEIIEAHHRMKRDAPSGTALALGNAAAAARRGAGHSLGRAEIESARAGRTETRREGDIGFAVVRGGDIVGEHSVLFAGNGERLTLSHSATDRAIFARGALQAALWLARQPAGVYSMRDFISSKSKT